MLPLTQAIAAAYNTGPNSAALKTALPGGLFFGKKPEVQGAPVAVSYPYCVCQVESSPATTSFGGPGRTPRVSEASVRFQVYGESLPDGSQSGFTQAGGAIDTLDQYFADTILAPTQTNWQNTNCYAMHEPRPMPEPEPETNENGNEVWMWFVTYVYAMRRT